MELLLALLWILISQKFREWLRKSNRSKHKDLQLLGLVTPVIWKANLKFMKQSLSTD